MNAIDMIKNRRSIRKYSDEIVPKALMEEIIEITRWSPSWTNSQTPRFTLVNDTTVISKIATQGVKGFVYNAATLENARNIAVLSFVKGKSGRAEKYEIETDDNPERWEYFDAGIACQTFCLAAHANGIGTCIFGIIDEKVIAEAINLPEDEQVAALIVYGYPNQEAKPPRRKEVEELVRFI